MYAWVEEYNMGHATVRLANKGSRMTNLPVHTATVAPGDRVIVDYSAEGQPYVRPLTIISPLEEIEQGISSPEEFEDTGLIACRLSRREPQSFQLWLNYGLGVWPRRFQMTFDTVEWETQEGLCVFHPAGEVSAYDGWWFEAPEEGKYICSFTGAVEPMAAGWGSSWSSNIKWWLYQQAYPESIVIADGLNHGHSRYQANKGDGVDSYVWSGTIIGNFYMPRGTFAVSVDVEPTGLPARPYSSILVSQGRYPVMDIWKVADNGPSFEAQFMYKYWD